MTTATTAAEETTEEEDQQEEIETLARKIGLDEDIIKAALELGIDEDTIEEAYQGQHNSDKEFAQDLADNIGSMDDGANWPYTCIDWEWAAREVMMDYSEQDGYYFRQM